MVIAAWVLLGLWAGWWAFSLRQDKLAMGEATWINTLDFLGGDFLSNYAAVRARAAGIDPYREPYGDAYGIAYDYSPLVMDLFSWCLVVPRRAAILLWMGAVAAVAALGAWASWRTRRALGLAEIPLPAGVAATLVSTPVLFAMERGNCDALVLLLALLGAWAADRRTPFGDLAAAFCLALATWVKPYALLAGLGLVAARGLSPLAVMGACFVALGLVHPEGTRSYLAFAASQVATYGAPFHPAAHPLSTYWPMLWAGTPLEPLAKVPGLAASAALLLPPALLVSWRFRGARPRGLLFPFLAWLLALATFLPPFSNDYNLIHLPIAALALWHLRDGWPSQLAMAALLLSWQPFQLPLSPKLVFAFKLAGLIAVGAMLLRRIAESGSSGAGAPSPRPASRPSPGLAFGSAAALAGSGALAYGLILAEARAAPLPDVSWRPGFSTLESSGALDWRWASKTGELHLRNWSGAPKTVLLEMTLAPAQDGPATLDVESAAFAARLTIAPQGTPFSRAVVVPPGALVIRFACDGRIVQGWTGDLRPLVFKVLNFRMRLEGVGRLPRDRAPLEREPLDGERREQRRGEEAPGPASLREPRQSLPRGEADQGRHEERLVAVAEHVRSLRAQQRQQQVGPEPGAAEGPLTAPAPPEEGEARDGQDRVQPVEEVARPLVRDGEPALAGRSGRRGCSAGRLRGQRQRRA
jgi:hypothetical protein